MNPDRNLVLVHQPGSQAIEDLADIAARVERKARDISVLIASNDTASSLTRKKAARLPSLVFSPTYLRWFQPSRGKVYAGSLINKVEQLRRLAEAGIAVPKYKVLGPDTDLSDFGELALVKPTSVHSSMGRGVRLMRTRNILAAAPSGQASLEEAEPGIVQQFIDTGVYPSYYRIYTFFGKPALAYRNVATRMRAALDAPDHELEASPITVRRSTGQAKSLIDDQDVLDLAARIHPVFPDVAWQACDIVRDAATGQLFVLEINPGGNTWVFSRKNTPEVIKELGGYDLQQQFNAFEMMADELIARTRSEAE